MVGYSSFQVGDTERLVAAWNRALPGDPITVDRFRSLVLLDVNFDAEGLRVARDGDRIVGAAYAVRRTVAMVGDDLEPGRGWIPFFFVTPSHRRRGVGARLMTEALDWLRGHGRTEADFASYTPQYILPGLDRDRYPAAAALLERHGFGTLYRATAMDLPLAEHTVPDGVRDTIDTLSAKGFGFGTPAPDELVPLIRLAHDTFNPDWARAIREAARAGVGADRIIVARHENEIIGWGMCGAYEAVIDRFGPFGVDSRFRGRGLGEALLHLCLERMRALGAHNAWFLWTGEQTPAGHLYRKTGFTVTRRFDIMRAPLTPEAGRS